MIYFLSFILTLIVLTRCGEYKLTLLNDNKSYDYEIKIIESQDNNELTFFKGTLKYISSFENNKRNLASISNIILLSNNTKQAEEIITNYTQIKSNTFILLNNKTGKNISNIINSKNKNKKLQLFEIDDLFFNEILNLIETFDTSTAYISKLKSSETTYTFAFYVTVSSGIILTLFSIVWHYYYIKDQHSRKSIALKAFSAQSGLRIINLGLTAYYLYYLKGEDGNINMDEFVNIYVGTLTSVLNVLLTGLFWYPLLFLANVKI